MSQVVMRDYSEPQPDSPSPRASDAQNRLARFAWNALGTFFLALGLIGIPLPLLPTTPFLLLAAACYLRGSRRMYNWMMTNRYFGTHLRDYLVGKRLATGAKITAIMMLWGVIAISVVFATQNLLVRVGLLAVAVAVTIHLLMLKTKRIG